MEPGRRRSRRLNIVDGQVSDESPSEPYFSTRRLILLQKLIGWPDLSYSSTEKDKSRAKLTNNVKTAKLANGPSSINQLNSTTVSTSTIWFRDRKP